jgi:hypothetical protein
MFQFANLSDGHDFGACLRTWPESSKACPSISMRTWKVHGLCSTISMHRNASVMQSPENVCPGGNFLRSMLRPQSIRHRPLSFHEPGRPGAQSSHPSLQQVRGEFDQYIIRVRARSKMVKYLILPRARPPRSPVLPPFTAAITARVRRVINECLKLARTVCYKLRS